MESMDEKMNKALSAPEAEIADAGFSDRVIGRLPRHRASVRLARWVSLACAACAGSALTLLLGPPVADIPGSLPALVGVLPAIIGVPPALLDITVVAAVLIAPAAWLFYAESRE